MEGNIHHICIEERPVGRIGDTSVMNVAPTLIGGVLNTMKCGQTACQGQIPLVK